MCRYDAIYARQSVDRADSISVESQIEICKREVAEGAEARTYVDKGYSGKSLDRPDFQALLRDMEAGLVRRVIVYRLDRISRSVLDFANLVDLFASYGVQFVSTVEKFDTSTPLGQAMLMIVMVFAQLERQTIQQRVIDAYRSRSRRGFYMGGKVPYGFQLKETVIDGVRTKMYAPVPEEAGVIRLIFSLYSAPLTSLGDVARRLTERGISKRDGKAFDRMRIRDMIVNPIYVRADRDIYDFFREQGTAVESPLEEFIGVNGAYLYSGDQQKRKTISLEGHSLVLAPHEGIVRSSTWLRCREKCLKNSQVAKPVKAKATWLAGKIKCGYCGYALTAKSYHCKTKADNRYYLCRGKYSAGGCTFGSLDADAVEEIVFQEIVQKLEGFKTLSAHEEGKADLRELKLRAQIEDIDREIAGLLEKLPLANESVMTYINQRVSQLDGRKKSLHTELRQFHPKPAKGIGKITDYIGKWGELTVGDKMQVVDALIERIRATETSLEIDWKI